MRRLVQKTHRSLKKQHCWLCPSRISNFINKPRSGWSASVIPCANRTEQKLPLGGAGLQLSIELVQTQENTTNRMKTAAWNILYDTNFNSMTMDSRRARWMSSVANRFHSVLYICSIEEFLSVTSNTVSKVLTLELLNSCLKLFVKCWVPCLYIEFIKSRLSENVFNLHIIDKNVYKSVVGHRTVMNG